MIDDLAVVGYGAMIDDLVIYRLAFDETVFHNPMHRAA